MNRAGQVRIEGLISGPSAAWSPTREQLVDALRRAGVPLDLLCLHLEGGQVLIEADARPWSRSDFVGRPAESVAMALGFLLETAPTPAPEDWMSTLRVHDHHQDHKVEALLALSVQGVRLVGREVPWRAAPAVRWHQRLLHHWPMKLLILLALLLGAWISRDQLRAQWLQIWPGSADQNLAD